MADVFKGELLARIAWKWVSAGATDSNKVEHSSQVTDGFMWDQGEAVWYDESATLADAATRTLDLTSLTRTLFGDTLSLTFQDIRGLIIVNETRTTDIRLIVGDAGSNEWSEPFGADGDTVKVEPGSPLVLANALDGWDVDATNKNLKLTASGGTVTYSIAIIGATSAGASGSGSGT